MTRQVVTLTMGKAKAKKADGHIPQRHLRARISYLHRAAAYMHNLSPGKPPQTLDESPKELPSRGGSRDLHGKPTAGAVQSTEEFSSLHATPKTYQGHKGHDALRLVASGQTYRFVSHLRAVSLKGQIRLSAETKHSICKRCDSHLVVGSTATRNSENKSRGGKKPWAEVVVIGCNTCGVKKRFPVAAKRQPRRHIRDNDSKDDSKVELADLGHDAKAHTNS